MQITATVALLFKAIVFVSAAVSGTRAELQADGLEVDGPISHLEQREDHKGRAFCGNFANADYVKTGDLLGDLKRENRLFQIQAGQCNRVHCWDTSAIYVCNDNGHMIRVNGVEIANSLSFVRKYCCHDGPRSKSEDNIVNGQQFTPWGWNTVLGYGNCNDPANIRPHMAGGYNVNDAKACPYRDYPSQPFD